jgi:hypothetical protein
MITDKRDQRDPTQLGQAILDRPDKAVPAHVQADKVLAVSNGYKPWQKIAGLKRTWPK